MALAPPADKHQATLEIRAERAAESLALLQDQPVQFLLDDAATGLQLVASEGAEPGKANLRMLHEHLGIPYVTHFVDPIPVCLQALPTEMYYQALMSNSWVKLVADSAHVYEMQQFQVPNVFHMPMASWTRDYDTSPLDVAKLKKSVSFVGTQKGSLFYPEKTAQTRAQLPGVIAQCARTTQSEMLFYDIYYTLYGLANPPSENDSPSQRAEKLLSYYSAKLYYTATQWIEQRDRFVLLLRRHLADRFDLYGGSWDVAYGLQAKQPFPSMDEYLNHFRNTLINVNLVGCAEAGVNMRTYEITAAGGFMLHHYRPELEQHFEIGKECDAFSDEQELLAKCQYYLAHPERAVEIAAAGQKRALNEHLYSHRLQSVIAMINQAGSQARDQAENQTGVSQASPAAAPTVAAS